MKRKDYKLIAEAIKGAKDYSKGACDDVLLYLIGWMETSLKSDNQNFKEDIFKKACGF